MLHSVMRIAWANLGLPNARAPAQAQLHVCFSTLFEELLIAVSPDTQGIGIEFISTFSVAICDVAIWDCVGALFES